MKIRYYFKVFLGMNKGYKLVLSIFFLATALCLSACQSTTNDGIGEYINEGYVFNPNDLLTIHNGSSNKQVLLALGTPTLETDVIHKIYYYISQKRYRPAEFMDAKIVDRKIFALYFDKDDKVQRVANYGLKDGAVFDFISHTTPSAYQEDSNMLNRMMQTTKLLPAGLPTNTH